MGKELAMENAYLADSEALLAQIDDDQRLVATTLNGPLCVIAGAGSGKTRAITYRIAYGCRTHMYREDQVMALSFTRKAAGEMGSRLRDLGVNKVATRTFHSAALRQLQYFWPYVVGGPLPQLINYKLGILGEVTRNQGLDLDKATLSDLSSEIEWAKVAMISPDNYINKCLEFGRPVPDFISQNQFVQIMHQYEKSKLEQGIIDFEDVLLLVVGMLLEYPEIASQIRKQYRHFVVDEYQDVSPLQQRLLELWLGNSQEICVVGDPSQTIYSFAGATDAFLLDFPARYPTAQIVKLTRDYRSCPEVVQVANQVIAQASSTERRKALQLRSQLKTSGLIDWQIYPDDNAEALQIAHKIKDLHTQLGQPYQSMAVLFRTNSQSAIFEKIFNEQQIPLNIVGATTFFQRREVTEAILLLRAARRTYPDLGLCETVRLVLSDLGWKPEPPNAQGERQKRWESLNTLVELADQLALKRKANFADFLNELDIFIANQHEPSTHGVTLISLHAAKGLEWETVFLTGMSEGLLPISLAQTPADLAEERRLLYVGITRAKQRLYISYAASRNGQGRSNRQVSSLLKGIWPNSEDNKSGLTVLRTNLQNAELISDSDFFNLADSSTSAFYQTLLDWRATQARIQNVPPHLIISNRSLQEIAVFRPETASALKAIRGISLSKFQRYGQALLALIKAGQT